MSNEMEELPPWGGARWFFSVVLLVLLHLGALFLVSGLGEQPAVREAEEFTVRMMTEPGDGSRLLAQFALNDPTLLASANPRGFSGPAWLNITPPPFKLPDWHDEQRWLTQRVADLGGDFRIYVRTNLGTTLSIADQPRPRESSIGVAEETRRSRIFVVGDLAERQLLDRPELEARPASVVLLPTRVDVLVNRDGFVFSPRLSVSGLEVSAEQRAADREALKLIPKIRFAASAKLPESDDFPFDRGTVIFQWITQSPVVTNAPSKR